MWILMFLYPLSESVLGNKGFGYPNYLKNFILNKYLDLLNTDLSGFGYLSYIWICCG